MCVLIHFRQFQKIHKNDEETRWCKIHVGILANHCRASGYQDASRCGATTGAGWLCWGRSTGTEARASTSQAALAGPVGSYVQPLVATRLAEERKFSDYVGDPEAQEIIPFALEVTGRYGRCAAEYLGRLSYSQRVTEYSMRGFYRDVSHILAFHFGRAFVMARQRVHIDPGPN